jgi:hypothetical protein
MSEPAQLALGTPVARLYGEPLIEIPHDLYIRFRPCRCRRCGRP